MRKSGLLLFIFLVVSGAAVSLRAQVVRPAADVAKADKLKMQATQMATAFNKGDFAAFVSFVYPKMVQAQGGADAMVRMLNQQVQEWQGQGISMNAVTVGEPSKIVKAGNELHALIDQTLVMNVKGGTLTKHSYLLAISPNNGVKWYFMDTAPLTNSNVRRLFPNYNQDLVIPAKQQPMFKAH